MNHYKFEEIELGMHHTFCVTITQEMVTQFANMSGDMNPMHTNDAYAKGKGFEKSIVYGMCTASLYSTLVGVYLPGENCLFQQCDVSWSLPVYVGDRLEIEGIVTEKDDRFHTITVKGTIRNQDGKKVSRARLVARVR